MVKKGKRILVIDDDPGIGEFLSIKLKLEGYDVITTTSGAKGIDLIRTREPDLLLLDVWMPDMSGLEVLETVRTFSQLPVIIFSGLPDIVKYAEKHGVNDFIAKPFNPDILVGKMKHLLNPT